MSDRVNLFRLPHAYFSRYGRRLASSLIAFVFVFGQAALAGDNLNSPGQPYLMQTRTVKPVEFQRRTPTLEEMIQRAPYPSQFQQAIPLHGVRIPGLTSHTVDTLGFNYFIVVDNTKYSRMSDIYKDCRLRGKSNFVTADSIIHPYLAFTNRVLADVAIKQMRPDLALLLQAIQDAAIADYKQADDEDVRSDIEKNIAYLTVGLRLLNPSAEMPRVGQVPELVDEELANIYAGKPATSVVFQRQEDFSQLKPVGWYNANSDLQNFYRCRQWLSVMGYPIMDVSIGASGHSTNAFRRSVLLYRSLDGAEVLGKPASQLWQKVVKANALFGTAIDNLHERTLYAADYKLVFQNRPADLKALLSSLAEPLYRTKLMLAIRKQKPMNLGATSIFDLDDSSSGDSAMAIFRLFPMVQEPEMPWLRAVARIFPTDKEAAASWPVALLDMYAWGAPQAGNLLSDNLFSLDPKIAQALPELQRCVVKRLPGGQAAVVDSRPWKLLSSYFKPITEQPVPAVLRTDIWGSRRLVSAFGGWVDAVAAIAPDPSDRPAQPAANLADATAATPSAPASETAATADSVGGADPTQPANAAPRPPRKVSKVVPYHYLDPALEIYRGLEADATKLQADLEAAHYFPECYRQRFADFLRLFKRLEKIADQELRGIQIAVLDRRLLANIDQILDKVDVPLPLVLTMEAPSKPDGNGKQKTQITHGYNLAVGRPGELYVIYQNPRTLEWTLARGAVYTYYEMPAPLLSDTMWQHKIEAGFARPPMWMNKFEIVQSPDKTYRPAIVDAHR